MSFDRETDADLLIERLNIRLPEGFESRADSIARHVARGLRGLSLASIKQAEHRHMNIPAVSAASGETDGVIARRIAGAIHRQIASSTANGAGERQENGGGNNAG